MIQNLFGRKRLQRADLRGSRLYGSVESGTQLAMLRVALPFGLTNPTPPVEPEPTFVIEVHLQKPISSAGWGSWHSGHFRAVDSWDLGGIEIFDLETNPILLRSSGFDLAHIYVPRRTFEVYAKSNGQQLLESFQCKAGQTRSM